MNSNNQDNYLNQRPYFPQQFQQESGFYYDTDDQSFYRENLRGEQLPPMPRNYNQGNMEKDPRTSSDTENVFKDMQGYF